jgi:hypothetical protein
MLVSAWHDGELDRPGQGAMIDHLIECAGCRDFYRDARELGALAAAVGTPAGAAEPSPGLWRRIERAARRDAEAAGRAPSPGWLRRLPAPAWAVAGVAAAVVVMVAWRGLPGGPAAAPAPVKAPIRIGGDPGGMDDARFLALTAQVLQADRRYREAFYQVMKQVVEDTAGHEASMDPPADANGTRKPTGGTAL